MNKILGNDTTILSMKTKNNSVFWKASGWNKDTEFEFTICNDRGTDLLNRVGSPFFVGGLCYNRSNKMPREVSFVIQSDEGIEKGEKKALIKTAIKLLTRKFGVLPEDLKRKISKLDTTTLEIIIGDILDYQSLEDIKKYIDK